jgi:hypothetical protein
MIANTVQRVLICPQIGLESRGGLQRTVKLVESYAPLRAGFFGAVCFCTFIELKTNIYQTDDMELPGFEPRMPGAPTDVLPLNQDRDCRATVPSR